MKYSSVRLLQQYLLDELLDPSNRVRATRPHSVLASTLLVKNIYLSSIPI